MINGGWAGSALCWWFVVTKKDSLDICFCFQLVVCTFKGTSRLYPLLCYISQVIRNRKGYENKIRIANSAFCWWFVVTKKDSLDICFCFQLMQWPVLLKEPAGSTLYYVIFHKLSETGRVMKTRFASQIALFVGGSLSQRRIHSTFVFVSN